MYFFICGYCLLADNAAILQLMLNTLHNWCLANSISANSSKSSIVHFDPFENLGLILILHVGQKD